MGGRDRRCGWRGAAAGLIAAAALLAGASAAQAEYPVIYNLPAGWAATEAGQPPQGANDWSCKPTAVHPNPVVLVPGLSGSSGRDYQAAAPLLANNGYCVFAFDFSENGFETIEDSAAGLSAFVDQVIAATGAVKVDLVGHSQGGMMPRYYLKFLGGAGRVDDLVGLAPSNHGTTTPLAPLIGPGCRACAQQVAGSRFMTRLNAGDETPGNVSYTVIETRNDEVVTPYASAFLPRGPRTTNVLLQDDCPLDPAEHVSIIYDPVALQWIENALARPGPADASFKPTCTP